MLKLVAGLAPVSTRTEPTSLLKHLAGEFAARVAALWPEPHCAFLAAPAARRHLVCLALALGRDLRGRADSLLTERLRHAIPSVVDDAPGGLERVLGRAGEVAWDRESYRAIVRLLHLPVAARVLRHAHTVEVAVIRRLIGLPAPMGEAVKLATALTDEGVLVVREAHDLLRLRDGADAAEAAAFGWSDAANPKAMFEAIRDDLTPEPLAPPHPGTARLRPLATKAAMKDAGKRFRNCLADRGADAATGWAAFYEWIGPPAAVVSISRDHIFGWRLDEARIEGNDPVPAAAREEIISELALMRVHVGRSGWQFDRLLREDVGRGYRYDPASREIGEAFGD